MLLFFSLATKKVQPTHVFLILMRCTAAKWRTDYRVCESTAHTTTLSFVLPLVSNDNNCLVSFCYIIISKKCFYKALKLK